MSMPLAPARGLGLDLRIEYRSGINDWINDWTDKRAGVGRTG